MDRLEQYYSICFQFWVIGENLIGAVVFACLCRDFSLRKRRIWMVGAAFWALMMVLYYLPWEFGFSGACGISLAAAWVVWICLDPGESFGKIYLTLTFGTLIWICMVIASNFYLMVSDGFDYFVYRFTRSSDKTWQLFFVAFNVMEFLHFIILGLLLSGSAALMKKCFLRRRCSLNQKELCILLIPSALGVFNHLIRRAYNSKVEMQLSAVSKEWHIDLLWCVNDLILIAAILLVLLLFERHKQQMELQQDRSILQEQVRDMKSHIRAVEQIYASIRGLKHDLGNHALVLRGLLAKGNYEEAQVYAGTLADAAERLQYGISTGNPVTDVIINEKRREAEERGITFQVDFRYPQTGGIDAFDISIILNNGLENAFAGAMASKNPFVSVHAGQKKHTWLLTIVNSFAGELRWEEESGLPKTTKEPGVHHGYGLKNIRSVAEQYYGCMELCQRESGEAGNFWEKQVVLTVMLQLTSADI